MIKIERTRDPLLIKHYTGANLSKKLENLLEYYYLDKGKIDFKPKARQVWGKAKAQLKVESYEKCAYCEADTAVVAHGDVEHFRPKDTYWWLAYCYDNYTFACQICNQSYKGVHFPISGSPLSPPVLPKSKPRQIAKFAALASTICPDPAISSTKTVNALFSKEKSYLIDPYLKDPEKFFAWHADDVVEEVRLIKNGARGSAAAVQAAEKYLGLNREELCRLRWNEYKTLEIMALAFQNGKFPASVESNLKQQILKHAESKQSFAGMHRYFLREWGFLPPL